MLNNVYSLDVTGTNPANLSIGELVPLSNRPVRSATLKYGAFFTKNLKVYDNATGTLLTRGTQYLCVEIAQDASMNYGSEIAFVILITDPTVSNTVRVDCQYLGGGYQNVANMLSNLYDNFVNMKGPINWVDVANKPSEYTPALHNHALNQVYGFESIVTALERLKSAVVLGDAPSFQFVVEWCSNEIVNLRSEQTLITNSLQLDINKIKSSGAMFGNNNYIPLTVNTVLTNAVFGNIVELNANNLSIELPALSTSTKNQSITFKANFNGTITLAANEVTLGNFIDTTEGTMVSLFVLAGETITLITNTNAWVKVIGGMSLTAMDNRYAPIAYSQIASITNSLIMTQADSGKEFEAMIPANTTWSITLPPLFTKPWKIKIAGYSSYTSRLNLITALVVGGPTTVTTYLPNGTTNTVGDMSSVNACLTGTTTEIIYDGTKIHVNHSLSVSETNILYAPNEGFTNILDILTNNGPKVLTQADSGKTFNIINLTPLAIPAPNYAITLPQVNGTPWRIKLVGNVTGAASKVLTFFNSNPVGSNIYLSDGSTHMTMLPTNGVAFSDIDYTQVGNTTEFFCDGINIVITTTGNALVKIRPIFDDTGFVANTAWVNDRGLAMSTRNGVNSSTQPRAPGIGNLPNVNYPTVMINSWFEVNEPNVSIVLPNTATVLLGSTVTIKTMFDTTLFPISGFIGSLNNSTGNVVGINMPARSTITLVNNGGFWYVVSQGFDKIDALDNLGAHKLESSGTVGSFLYNVFNSIIYTGGVGAAAWSYNNTGFPIFVWGYIFTPPGGAPNNLVSWSSLSYKNSFDTVARQTTNLGTVTDYAYFSFIIPKGDMFYFYPAVQGKVVAQSVY